MPWSLDVRFLRCERTDIDRHARGNISDPYRGDGGDVTTQLRRGLMSFSLHLGSRNSADVKLTWSVAARCRDGGRQRHRQCWSRAASDKSCAASTPRSSISFDLPASRYQLKSYQVCFRQHDPRKVTTKLVEKQRKKDRLRQTDRYNKIFTYLLS